MNQKNKSKTMTALLVAGLAACAWAPFGFAQGGQGLTVWELPPGAEAANREGWKVAKGSGAFVGGAALDNGKIAAVAAVGGEGVLLLPADRSIKASALIVPVTSSNKPLGKIMGVKLGKQEESDATLKVAFEGAELGIDLSQGQVFVTVNPGKGVGAIEVGGRTAYAVMPDFFGHDVVYDPKRLKSDAAIIPAENLLLNMQSGGDAIIMCMWQGPLSLGKEKQGDEKEPRVDLVLTGKGAARLVEKTRHECDGQPLYVALLAKKGVWFEKDIGAEPAQKTMALDWDRPYEAKWRVDFLGKEGTFCNDFTVKDVSWDVSYDSEHGGMRDEAGNPAMWFQGGWLLFTLPAFVQDTSSKKMFVTSYSDYGERDAFKNWNNSQRERAKKAKTTFVPAYPPSYFDQLIVYPIGRRKETPLNEKTATDVMRDCLGVGPCEYVLDLEGLKTDTNKTCRNGHAVGATCGTWDGWVSHFAEAARGKNSALPEETRNGKKGVALTGLKAGERFQPEDELLLVEKLEDFGWFVDIINKRLHQYNTFAKTMIDLCNSAVSNNPAIKPVAEAVKSKANGILQQCPDNRLAGFTKECGEWQKKMDGVVADVKAGNYKNIGSTANIREFAVHQDNLMGVLHRLVKGMRQAASAVDSSDPAVAEFANKARAMCHDMLRNKGHFEY